MAIKVITDTSCDLPDELLRQYHIEMVPLRVSFEDGATYLDRFELSPSEFMKKMRSFKTLPKTAAPDPAVIMKAFEKGLDEAGEVLFISLSSGMSCTCQSAHLACQMLNTDKVQIFDSLSATLGTGIMAVKAARMADRGLSLAEIVQSLTIIRKSRVMLVTLDTLENVVKGGRLKKYEGISGNLLRIKPIMRVNDEGRPEVIEKARGRKRAVGRLLEMIGEYAGKSISDLIMGVSHASCLSEAQGLAVAIKNRYQVKEDIIISDMGATIGTYAGEGGLVVSF